MAIDLNKEHYNNKDSSKNNIRTVYPETESEEIYPQKEIYPGNSIPAEENIPPVQEVYPQNEVRHIETVQDRALTNPAHNDIINKKDKKNKKKKHKRRWIFWVILIVIIAAVSENYREISSMVYTNFMDGTFSDTTADFSAVGIKTLSLTDSSSDVTVRRSSDDKFHISVKTPDDKTYDMKSENGAITVNGSEHSDVFSLFEVNSEITLYIPDSYEGDIVIDNKNSTINCSAGTSLDFTNSNGRINICDINGTSLRIKNENASVNFSNVTADSVKAENKNSSISAQKTSAASLDLSAKNSSVNVEGCSASEYASLYSGNGSINAERCSFDISSSLIASNGSVNAADCVFTGDSVVNSDNGRVSMEDFSFENMTIRSKNGSINCEAYGSVHDYSISASAKNGSVDVPVNDSGEYTLDLSSDNGKEEFDFDGSKPAV